MSEDSNEEKLLKDILDIEKHEDRMITAMVQLMASSERLNRRLDVLTWIMLILTWIAFVIAVPNTLATVFGIPRVSEALGLEVMMTILGVSTVAALLLLLHPGFGLSITSINKKLRRVIDSKDEIITPKRNAYPAQSDRKRNST